MYLYINTTLKDKIIVAIKEGDKFLFKKNIKTKYTEAEKLLLEIDKLLKKRKIKLENIKKIKVENISNENTSFTALRIGIVTANAIAYALGIKIVDSNSKEVKNNIIIPKYSKEPNITIKKSN